jgi:hypothetical protein
VQDPCGVTNPTGIQRHLDALLFDLRRLPPITIVQQKGATGTTVFAAPVSLLALPGLTMADDIGPVTVRTVQGLENHDTTQSRWGYSVAETCRESSTSTPLRHLPRVDRAPRSCADGQPCGRTHWEKRCSHSTVPLAVVPMPGSSFCLLPMPRQ